MKSNLLSSAAAFLLGTAAACGATQSKPETKVVYINQDARPYNACEIMRSIGLRDPSCEKDKEFEAALANISRAMASIVAEIYYVQSREYVAQCLHVQQYSSTTVEYQRQKCADEIMDILDMNPKFRDMDLEMQGMIQDELRRMIVEQ